MVRINELTGYKSNPIYKKAKKVFDPGQLGLGPIDMQMADQRHKFSRFLKIHGFHRMGEGSFGDAYEKKGYPWIFKLFNRDPSYLMYVNYCVQNQSNPAVPKFKGRTIKINADTFLVRMERLQPLPKRDPKFIKLMQVVANIEDVDDFNNMTNEKREFLAQNFPDILKILTDISKFSHDFDLHSDNFMMRGNTVVLIDPLYPIDENSKINYDDFNDEEILNELIGYKANPIYNKAKELYHPDALKNSFDNDDRASFDLRSLRNNQLSKFTDYLEQHGFRQLGSGAFGGVFDHPAYPWVFKIFSQDRAYLSYLNYVIKHQNNPYVPKIKGKIIKINDDTYAVRMEKLTPYTGMASTEATKLYGFAYRLGKGYADQYDIAEANEDYPALVELITYLKDSGWPLDLHDGNFMMRGDTIVLTDPIFDEKNLNETILHELIGYKANPIYQQANDIFKIVPKQKYGNPHFNPRRAKLIAFKDVLKKQGFTIRGAGGFGVIFEKPGYPWLFKLFNIDPAYMAYINYCIAHQSNPSVPKIKGKMIKINDETYVIRTEELTDPDRAMSQSEDLFKFAKLVKGIRKFNDFKQPEIEWLREKFPHVLQILEDLSTVGYEFDLHNGNYMMRDNTVVLIDPLIHEPLYESMLGELIGYKSNPIYKKAKLLYSPDALNSDSYGVRSKRLQQTDKFQDFLRTHGFKRLGSGSFGLVFEKPGYPWVFKIFTQDPAYLDYIKYAMANQSNPSVPRIKGKLIKINDNTYAVRMEKLTSIGNFKDGIELLSITNNYNDTDGNLTPDETAILKRKYPGILKILLDLKKCDWPIDLHDGNIMVRNNRVPVIIDPTYDPKGMKEGQLNELIGYKSNPIYQTANTMLSTNAINRTHKVHRNTGPSVQIQKFRNYLESQGFKILGYGSFGVAFQSPDYPWVFKIFTRDNGFLTYIKWVMKNQNNSNVPRTKGKIIKINDDTYAIRMEKLTEIKSQGNSFNLDGDEYDLVRILEPADKIRDISDDNLKWIKTNFPGIFSILEFVGRTRFNFDMSIPNIMERGNTLVIIDPIFERPALNESDGIINELTGYKNHPVYKTAQTRYSQMGFAKSRSANLIKDLQQQGYKFEFNRSGTKGSVLKREGDPYVIKIFQRDPQYMKYVLYAIDHQDNPHVPKIKGRPIKIMNDTYAIRMEELYPLHPTSDQEKQILASIYSTQKWAKFYLNKSLRAVDLSLYKLLTDLSDVYGPGTRPDFSEDSENIMQRQDGTLVINDPMR